MYTFLVVEDEQYVRDSVVFILSELNGGEGVLSAENGAAALAILDRTHIDAVITDIMMPIVDGIALLKAVSKRDEKIATAVLSGYDDFDYIQNSMSCGAIDYILKPFERGDIVKLYYKLLRKIRSREALEREVLGLLQRTNEIKPYIRQRYYFDLIGGRLSDAAFDEMSTFLGLHIKNIPLRIALLEIDEGESCIVASSNEGHVGLYKVLEIMESIIAQWPECDSFNVTNNTLAIVWCPVGGAQDAEELKANIGLLINELFDVYKIVLNVGVSMPVSGPKDAGWADESARNALRHKLILGSGQIFDDGVVNRDQEVAILQFDTIDIIESIWINKPEAAKELIKTRFQAIRTANPTPKLSSIQLFCYKMLVDCLMELENECGTIDELFTHWNNGVFQQRFTDLSINEAEHFFCRLTDDICSEISRSRKNEFKRTIARAKQIISARYEQDIGIDLLAKELHYSKNYFGQLFKNETGMSVNEYINQVRIQKAKELLVRQQHRINEVAEMVGFHDQQYFAKVFKRIVGCMPSDYVP
jgi:two-component system response regulator YesN